MKSIRSRTSSITYIALYNSAEMNVNMLYDQVQAVGETAAWPNFSVSFFIGLNLANRIKIYEAYLNQAAVLSVYLNAAL